MRSRPWAVIRCIQAAMLLLCMLAPAGADLKISGDSSRAGYWTSLYDRIPESWKTRRTIVVRELAGPDMARLVRRAMRGSADNQDDDSVIDGYYQSGNDRTSPTITLLTSLRGEQAAFVFIHEYCHFVWDEKLTHDQRAQFRRTWQQSRAEHHLVTRYAADSVEEGFAEAAAYYIRRPDLLDRRDPTTYDFVAELLNSRDG